MLLWITLREVQTLNSSITNNFLCPKPFHGRTYTVKEKMKCCLCLQSRIGNTDFQNMFVYNLGSGIQTSKIQVWGTNRWQTAHEWSPVNHISPYPLTLDLAMRLVLAMEHHKPDKCLCLGLALLGGCCCDSLSWTRHLRGAIRVSEGDCSHVRETRRTAQEPTSKLQNHEQIKSCF